MNRLKGWRFGKENSMVLKLKFLFPSDSYRFCGELAIYGNNWPVIVLLFRIVHQLGLQMCVVQILYGDAP